MAWQQRNISSGGGMAAGKHQRWRSGGMATALKSGMAWHRGGVAPAKNISNNGGIESIGMAGMAAS